MTSRGEPPGRRRTAVLRPKAAAEYLGLSRSTLYRLEKSGELAPRLRLGLNSSGWLVEDLDKFLTSRPRGGG